MIVWIILGAVFAAALLVWLGLVIHDRLVGTVIPTTDLSGFPDRGHVLIDNYVVPYVKTPDGLRVRRG